MSGTSPIPAVPGLTAHDQQGWVGRDLVNRLARAVTRDPGIHVPVLACVLFPDTPDPLPATHHALVTLGHLYTVRRGRVYPR